MTGLMGAAGIFMLESAFLMINAITLPLIHNAEDMLLFLENNLTVLTCMKEDVCGPLIGTSIMHSFIIM